ncbi:hypothetical protein A0H81_01562 [Grifola frondosa]|uniref:BRCA2 OB1 domain-containing protein n=1 Tax=Grifola frondosa TaxID=5627 RepID=A0A1C7MQZ2_GRIFR|nr:hypothetical protein A0H81_01562 [Grifola frondosa]
MPRCPDSPSPSRKRQRLSSPTYDELSQEELNAFDEVDRKLSQSQRSSPLARSEGPPDMRGKESSLPFVLPNCETGLSINKERDQIEEPSSSPLEARAIRAGFVSAATLPTQKDRPKALGFTSASNAQTHKDMQHGFSGFTSAAVLHGTLDSEKTSFDGALDALPLVSDLASMSPSPPDAQPEQDYASWFESSSTSLPEGAISFTSARAILDSGDAGQPDKVIGDASTSFSGFTSGFSVYKSTQAIDGSLNNEASTSTSILPGFISLTSTKTSGKKHWTALSAEALERAAKKMKKWEEELEKADCLSPAQVDEQENIPTSAAPPGLPSFQTPARAAFRAVENSPGPPPDTPCPAGTKFKKPLLTGARSALQTKKPFKSPLVNTSAAKLPRPAFNAPTFVSSPLNPSRPIEFASGSKLPAPFPFSTPVTPSRAGPSTPVRTAAGASSAPARALGLMPRRVGVASPSAKPKVFVTPFKPGMAPGEPGRSQLKQSQATQRTEAQKSVIIDTRTLDDSNKGRKTLSQKMERTRRTRFFNMTPPSGRQTLASCGLTPQSYTTQELESMGMCFLLQILNLRQHPCWAAAALEQLLEKGCNLATSEWVENHWSMILWKLAGMVCLEPQHESNPETRRWCWTEVMRQLLYRYERELNGGSRPALRMISTEDAPASCPMVLCVSNIIWSGESVDDGGFPVERHPELEVTDGWYRLRARVDLPLARAIRRGVISIGRKIAIAGARLSSGRKGPCEILKAYDSTVLEIFGNSSHLAPWHAKLGFQKQPYVATLDSLTRDGGVVTAVELVMTKLYPLGFLEFIEDDDGKITREGPRNDKDEAIAHDKWMAKREREASKLRQEFEKKLAIYEDYADKLEDLAGPRWRRPWTQMPPSIVERLYDEIEDYRKPFDFFISLPWYNAGWLSVYIRQQVEKDRAAHSEELERELNTICPPRAVRSFRIIAAHDARWSKSKPTRTVQLTVWDILKLTLDEDGKAGDIREGHKFLVNIISPVAMSVADRAGHFLCCRQVTNLVPTQQSGWMPPVLAP